MSWPSKRSQVSEALNKRAQVNTSTLSVDQLQILKQEYDQIRQGLTSYLTQEAQNYQLSNRLEQTGQLQGQIRRLEEEREKMKTDVETAMARDELLRSRDQTGNEHTLYLMNRPVRRGMVPYLWALSVLLVGVGVLFFYWLTPMILTPSAVNTYGNPVMGTMNQFVLMVTDIFMNPYTWMALFGAASIVILALSLKMAGVFGK
jgi:hypothetical protein